MNWPLDGYWSGRRDLKVFCLFPLISSDAKKRDAVATGNYFCFYFYRKEQLKKLPWYGLGALTGSYGLWSFGSHTSGRCAGFLIPFLGLHLRSGPQLLLWSFLCWQVDPRWHAHRFLFPVNSGFFFRRFYAFVADWHTHIPVVLSLG